METQEELKFLTNLIEQITARYAILSDELPDLRIVADNTRVNSELKKYRRESTVFPRRKKGERRRTKQQFCF